MTIATAIYISLACAGAVVAREHASLVVIACNLNAIGSGERPRYNALIKRLRTAIRNRNELPDGYAYRLEQKAITLPEVAEWMALERLCCPFLNFELSAAGPQENWLLTLTGPEGIKPLLQAEFPAITK
jgi:hypothetical protein